MSYGKLFEYCGRDRDEARVSITGYLEHPDKLTQDRIKSNDQTAARIIREAEEVIAMLQEYRKGLADRYAQLSTAPYTLRLELERYRGYSDKRVFYYIRIIRRYEDGTEVKELSETYKGQQRREALARYEELRKQRPGIETVKDIEKGRWER